MKTFILFISILFLFAFNIKAQSFPHLNASTGNKGEFIVDVDSNIFMFHGNRIEKLDKNFNPVWINNYSDLTFKNLLLSKTGSLYFIAKGFDGSNFIDRTGKIESDGSLTWCKALPSYTAIVSSNTQTISLAEADQILLDQNNNLVITGISNGNMYFLKLDTLSNFIKLNLITNYLIAGPKISNVLSDVSGVYTVSSWGYGFEGPVYNLVYKYSDISNFITKDSLFQMSNMGTMNQYPSSNEHIIKSKNQSNVFYLAYNTGNNSSTLDNTFSLKKINSNTIIWGIQFQTSMPNLMDAQNIEEDHLKNTFLSVSSKNVSTNKFEKWIVKIDSNGLCDNNKYNFLPNFDKASSFGVEDSITQLKHHFGNKFFYSIETSGSLPGPLSIVKMDSTIGSYCSPTASINVTTNNNYQYILGSVGHTTLTSISSTTMQAISSTVTSVLNFSVITSSCLALNTMEFNTENTIGIYPNPTSNIIYINSSSDFSISESTIFDITGKIVLSDNNQTTINVSKLNAGVYFIKVVTDKGDFKQKFIKE